MTLEKTIQKISNTLLKSSIAIYPAFVGIMSEVNNTTFFEQATKPESIDLLKGLITPAAVYYGTKMGIFTIGTITEISYEICKDLSRLILNPLPRKYTVTIYDIEKIDSSHFLYNTSKLSPSSWNNEIDVYLINNKSYSKIKAYVNKLSDRNVKYYESIRKNPLFFEKTPKSDIEIGDKLEVTLTSPRRINNYFCITLGTPRLKSLKLIEPSIKRIEPEGTNLLKSLYFLFMKQECFRNEKDTESSATQLGLYYRHEKVYNMYKEDIINLRTKKELNKKILEIYLSLDLNLKQVDNRLNELRKEHPSYSNLIK